MVTSRSTCAVLAVWALAALFVVGTVSGAHLLTLPTPRAADPRLAAALAATGGGLHGWTVVHVLRNECRCSQRIARYLAQRRASANVSERVLLTGGGEDTRRALQAAGFVVEAVSEQDLAERFGIEGVPLLVVTDDVGAVRYVGGYTPHKQGPVFADLRILQSLRAGADVAPLPLFGCATGPGLARDLDPLGLR